jgi:hypothetical protein
MLKRYIRGNCGDSKVGFVWQMKGGTLSLRLGSSATKGGFVVTWVRFVGDEGGVRGH